MKIIKANKVIYINAGHNDDPDTPYFDDPGAVVGPLFEGRETMLIRDECVPLLKDAGFEVKAVPDNLNLRKSIDWVNLYARDINDGLALSIHFNYAADPSAKGVETYYYKQDQTSKRIAEVLAAAISQYAGNSNRGAKSDITTRFGQLGWIRQTNCWSVLAEIEFLSNPEAMERLKRPGGYKLAAEGIVAGIREIYGIEQVSSPEPAPAPPRNEPVSLSWIEKELKRLQEWLDKILKGRS